MCKITIFTGNAGPGTAIAAVAAALAAAASGRRTLLLSLGPSHSLGPLLGVEVGATPAPVADRLDAIALDALADLGRLWDGNRKTLVGALGQVAGDELPLLPGADSLFGIVRLHEFAETYDRVMVDAGPHDGLLRALSLPDSLRWLVRLLFGLDRGPGRNLATLSRALLPVSLVAPDMVGRLQDGRVQAEAVRDRLTDPALTSVCYVLRPDPAALEEARLALPALQLHGLRVGSLAGGPLLPGDAAGNGFGPWIAAQTALIDSARTLWPTRPMRVFPVLAPDSGLAALRTIGEPLIREGQPSAPQINPVTREYEGAPALALDLPGMPISALQLTHSGDEMVIRVGPYRRHLLLPDGLRAATGYRATRVGDLLIIRKRA